MHVGFITHTHTKPCIHVERYAAILLIYVCNNNCRRRSQNKNENREKKKTRNIPKRTVLILPDNISQCTGLVLRGFFKFTGQTCHRDPCRRRHRRQQRMGCAGAAGDCDDDDDDERTPRGEQRDTPPRGAPVGRRRRSRQRDRTYFLFKLESCHSRCLFIVSKPH